MDSPIKILRHFLRLNQSQLVKEIGSSSPTISMAERGSPLGRVTVLLLCDRYRDEIKAAGLDVEDFLRGECRTTTEG